ncbi:FHA domain-containing protein [Lysobacter enzymogenes]|uniref:FHA domain-containing protein n=1 Tax=Lysobacter enzymogenes TaxID=69 RepID=UPI001AF86734|nr:FHA domain-containing protein [Lysobacter enzymogenes]QQQ02897.1 FHA domain-containing protein [Lysobacter enzymogenes]
MPARLIVYPPEAAAISRWIPAGSRLRIGRDPACELRIDHPSVSRQHAELTHGADGWRLLDSGSKNGSHVDGIQVAQAVLERSEAWLRFGDVLCEFSLHDEAEAQAWQERERERRALSQAWTRRLEVGAAPPAEAAMAGDFDAAAAAADLPGDILRGVVELAGCSRGFLLLAQGEDFLVQASLSLEHEDLNARAFSGSVGAVQRSLRERQPVVVNWIDDDPWLAQRSSVVTGGLQSLVCLPLLHAGRVLGAVYADRRGAGEAISQFDMELLAAFADSAALWLLAQRAFEALQPPAAPLRWTRVLGAQATSS